MEPSDQGEHCFHPYNEILILMKLHQLTGMKSGHEVMNFFMLNSTEHDISTAPKTKKAEKWGHSLPSNSQMLYFHAHKCLMSAIISTCIFKILAW